MDIVDFFETITNFLQTLFLASETLLEWFDSVAIFGYTLFTWLYILLFGLFILSLINDYFNEKTNDRKGDNQ